MANLADQRLLALIVDRYLNDNNFSQTRTSFRNEAPFLFNYDSPNINQISMNMMGLDEILNELKLLKDLMIQEMFLINLDRDRTQTLLQGMQCAINSYYNHTGITTPPEFLVPQSINTNARTGNVSTSVMLDQERFLMEQQRSYQTQLLLFSMQNLINTYNGNTTQPHLLNPNFPAVPPPPNVYSAEVPQPKLGSRTPTGVTTPSARFLVPQSIITDATNITTTQKTSNILSAPPSINAENGNFSTNVMMSVSNRKRKDTEEMDATSIGKKSRGRSSSRKIPVQDQNTSPQSNNVVNKQTVSQPSSMVPQPKLGNRTPTGVNTITTPLAGFLVPQSINTDTTTGNVSTPVGVFDNDLHFLLIDDDLETFGDIFINPDSLWEGFDFSDHPTSNHVEDTASRPSHECKSQQVTSELPSTAAKVLSEKDMNVQGPDSLTTMKSFKNRTTNLSSKRNRQHGFGKENC